MYTSKKEEDKRDCFSLYGLDIFFSDDEPVLILLLRCFTSAVFLITTIITIYFCISAQLTETLNNLLKNADSGTTASLAFEHCVLPKYDAWDDPVLMDHDHKFDYRKGCPLPEKPVTELAKGTFKVVRKGFECQFRCAFWDSEYSNKYGGWEKIAFEEKLKVDCELGKNETKKDQTASGKFYSVYVLLIDSISTQQTIRNMPATLAYMEKQMKAITFPFVNKIGLNSYPNAMALWFNKQIKDNNQLVFDLPIKKADSPGYSKTCHNYLNKSEFIMNLYERKGYKTFLAEDWAKGAVVWPNCYGFQEQPTHHNMRPYHVLLESKQCRNLTQYQKKNCIEAHPILLDYLGQFAESYEGVPKFGWLWSSEASHYYVEQTVHVDLDFRNFLIDHRKEFENSFVILMGDHGLRFGKYAHSENGAFEAKNSHFTISIPRELRESTRLLDILRLNAQKLQSTFDVHATFRDIVMYQPEQAYSNYDPIAKATDRGHSLLRRQPEIDRNCKTLEIPFSFCMCKFEMKNVTTFSQVSKSIGSYIIGIINKGLKEANMTNKCEPVILNKALDIRSYKYSKEGRYQVFKATIKAAAPHNGIFRAHIRKSDPTDPSLPPTLDLVSDSIERLDKYGNAGSCAPYAVGHYCHWRPSSFEKCVLPRFDPWDDPVLEAEIRCALWLGEYHNKYDDWRDVKSDSSFSCDFVHLNCSNNATSEVQETILYQIVETQ
ncbi:unnamed protein product [Caenorhabditis auriculariae]|uniref:Uncharacterized protein n=1 Tax=Caenorhabditis auriculariae TaxID=2777116 RepID=A0A8S1GQJ6_9PELO|nr:unnamed protein product [Caenorhabditis auriculariae]